MHQKFRVITHNQEQPTLQKLTQVTTGNLTSDEKTVKLRRSTNATASYSSKDNHYKKLLKS